MEKEVCFVDFPSINNNGEFKYFWLLDRHQTDIKNAAVFGFPHGISSSHSNIHSTSQLLKFKK